MIISCASVLESPRRHASNTLPYDFMIELLVIKENHTTYCNDLVFSDNFMSTELFMKKFPPHNGNTTHRSIHV